MKAHVQSVPRSRQASFVFRVKADARFARGWHYHPEYELTYIQESRGRRFVGDSIESYRSGDLVLLGPNLPHTWRSEPTAPRRKGGRPTDPRREVHRAIVVQFRGDFLGEDFLAAVELAPVAALLERSRRGLRVTGETRDDVARRLTGMKRLDRLDRLLALLRTLGVLARAGDDLQPLSGSICAPPADATARRRFDRVLRAIHERYTQPLRQADVADIVGLSPSGFSRFFKRSTGKTFAEYVGELRIAHACNLLIETELPVIEVSLRSGFNNLSNFNRRFRKLQGTTPRAYRCEHAGPRAP